MSGDSHYLIKLESPGHGLKSPLAWLPLGVRAQISPSGHLTLGPGPHLYAVYIICPCFVFTMTRSELGIEPVDSLVGQLCLMHFTIHSNNKYLNIIAQQQKHIFK